MEHKTPPPNTPQSNSPNPSATQATGQTAATTAAPAAAMSPGTVMVWKAITIGLGGLLIAGSLALAMKLSNSGEAETPDTAQQIATPAKSYGYAAGVDLAALPPMPLRAGEHIASISAGEGSVFVVLQSDRAPSLRRVVAIASYGGGDWQELAVTTVTED